MGVSGGGADLRSVYRRVLPGNAGDLGPTVLLAAKTYGSVFYDKWTPAIARGKW